MLLQLLPPSKHPRRLAIAALLAALLATLPVMHERASSAVDVNPALVLYANQLTHAVAQRQARHLAERYRRPFDDVFDHVVTAHEAGQRHGLSPALLLAVAEVESSMDPSARSRYGAIGLMQVVPRHHPQVVQAAGGAPRCWPTTSLAAAISNARWPATPAAQTPMPPGFRPGWRCWNGWPTRPWPR